MVRVFMIAHREYFTRISNHIILHLILTYYFSESNYILLCYFILFMASPERDKEGVHSSRQEKTEEEEGGIVFSDSHPSWE